MIQDITVSPVLLISLSRENPIVRLDHATGHGTIGRQIIGGRLILVNTPCQLPLRIGQRHTNSRLFLSLLNVRESFDDDPVVHYLNDPSCFMVEKSGDAKIVR